MHLYQPYDTIYIKANSVHLKSDLHHLGEADQVCANAKPCTLARRNANGGGKGVKECKGGEGGHTDSQNLTKIGLLGVEHQERDKRDNQALNQIL